MTNAPQRLDLVRGEVRRVLDSSTAWQTLGLDERREFARNMVKIGDYLSKDPGWLDSPDPPAASGQVAEALTAVNKLQKRLAKDPGQVGQTFKAGAMQQGVEAFGDLVQTVDFPEFVSGLIQGVFQAIVDASIQQMQAFGELLAATAKSVDQFARDHVADDQAREQLASRFPSIVRIERTAEGNRMTVREDAEDTSALDAVLGEPVDLSDPEQEAKLVGAIKLELARQRQKMMALMVMLGINRIVVTNGRINAKVIFDIEANDRAKRMASAGMTVDNETEVGAAAATWAPWGAGGAYAKHKHKTTVRSSVDDESESSAKLKAQLTGEVRVNFRSETLPPEKLLEALDFDQSNFLSQAMTPGQPAPATQPPAPAGQTEAARP